ncbi:hypothetical protein [Streptomyces chryseus]
MSRDEITVVSEQLPVVTRAGLADLDTAALTRRSLTSEVLEVLSAVGRAVRAWNHMCLFAIWSRAVDAPSKRLPPLTDCTVHDGTYSPSSYADGAKQHVQLRADILGDRGHNGTTQPGIFGLDRNTDADGEQQPFTVCALNPNGMEYHVSACAVIDASGTWPVQSPHDGSGLPALGEEAIVVEILYSCPYLRDLAVRLDPKQQLCGTVDPYGVRKSTYLVKVTDFVEVKSYGRSMTFLVTTGYVLVLSLGGDPDAAKHVELTFPETGVCSGAGLDRVQGAYVPGSGCCPAASC